MPKGISLHIGLNAVDPKHYQGWEGVLAACESDAEDMASIAKGMGFSPEVVLTQAATRERILAGLGKVASSLEPGDIFVLSYSGHGGQLPDLSGDETDQEDETWCLYDGELVDDELYEALARIPAGVRVLTLSDSCHSGTMLKEAFYQGIVGAAAQAQRMETSYRCMPGAVAQRTYRANKGLYDGLLQNTALNDARSRVAASALLISGCQDNQLSSDGTFNGLFTARLLSVWRNGSFAGSYRQFHNAIVRLMPPDQTPNYYFIGAPDREFEAQRPFTI